MSNWKVRAYDVDDPEKEIASWVIENRTEDQATKEAEADIQMSTEYGDWSMEEIQS